MNHNVYLPDEISDRAKAASLNLSGLLRRAVTDALDRQEALEAAQDGMTLLHLDLDPRTDDNRVRLRFIGKCIAGAGEVDVPEVFLTDRGKVVVVFEEQDHKVFDDVDRFSDWVADPGRFNLGDEGEDIIRDALRVLGGREVIDL